MKQQIIPSVIAKNQNELDKIIKNLGKEFKHFQIDIMDEKFVKNKSNWFDLKLDKKYTYEAHLMINNPEWYIKKNYKKFEIIIVNYEKIKKPLELIKFLKNKKKKIGFALNPETSIMYIEPYLKLLNRVLILTVHPGQYGADFLPETLEKINMLRLKFKKDIEVDGHINPETLKLCKNAGANLFAVGSYIQNSKDIKKSKNELNRIINKT